MVADGVYQVTTAYFCAGFVIVDGKVIECAPILRGKLEHWIKVAKRVSNVETQIETAPVTSP